MSANRPTLWQRLWRRPIFRRTAYEALGLMLLRRPGLQMLNCGFAEEDYPHFDLTPEQEPERLGYQLYHRLVRYHPINGREVLEVGCGRGAGARFLAGAFHPRDYLAIDAARSLILAGRRNSSHSRLSFAAGRAEKLPAATASRDIILGVEMLSPLADKAAFLREAHRVLRPGGRLVLADFFYTRSTSPHSVDLFRNLARESNLLTITDEDWTARACRSLESDSPRRLAEIERLPALLRGPALAFAGTVHSPLYRQLADGRARYLHLVLRK